MPCPTCGAVHTPGTPHQPLQTMAQRPPPPPALEEDRPPPPAADPADSADAGDSQRDDDEPSAKGIARRENGPFAGKTNGSGAAQISRKTPPTGAGRRNGRTGAATARPIMGVQGTRLPPPPAGSPADTWDHYLRILPPGELAQRQSAREEINRTILDAGSREAQVAAGARYAHTDAEKEFLQYTGVLPTLDAEVDAGIRERETRRRASVRARRAAREAYQEARQTYRERFLAYTGQEPTFDTKQDTAVLDGEYTRRKEAVSEWGEQGNALADTFWTESQGRLDSRGGDLGTVDLHADPRYQQWLKSEPAFTVLPDGTGGVDNSDYKQFLADYFGQLETGERDLRTQLESAPALGTEITAVGEGGDTVQTYEAYDRDDFLAYTGEEPTGDLAADKATVLRVTQEREAAGAATEEEAYDRGDFLAYTGEEPTGDLSTDKATVLRVTQEGEAAANQELATVVNSMTPAQQRVYEAAVFEGQDPYDALKALSERTEIQNIHLEGVSEGGLAIAVNSLTPAQQRVYEAAVFEGQDPYDALKALRERTTIQNIHLEGVSERGLATVVNSMTPAQQQEYEAAVFEGQDHYEVLNTLRERTTIQNIHQQGVYERALASAANARDAAGVIGEPGSYQKQGGITAEQRERLPVAVSEAGASLGYRGVANAGTDALANAHREEGYVQAAGAPQVNQVDAVLTSIAGSNLAIRQEYHNAAANTVKPGNVTANLAALAGGNDANNRLKTITADNFDATIAAVGGRLYPRADNPNRTVYLGGEPMELHKLWENEAGQGGGAFTDNEKAQVAERLRDWSESGYLTFNKPPEGPDVTVIRLPRLEPVAGTPISFAAKRQRIRSFEREVAQAQADGKFIIVEQPKSTRERYADLGEYVIPGFGFIRADRQATDPDGPGGQHITPAEFKHIALEAMLAPVEFLPAPVGGAFKLGGKAIVKLGGEVATNVPSIVPTGSRATTEPLGFGAFKAAQEAGGPKLTHYQANQQYGDYLMQHQAGTLDRPSFPLPDTTGGTSRRYQLTGEVGATAGKGGLPEGYIFSDGTVVGGGRVIPPGHKVIYGPGLPPDGYIVKEGGPVSHPDPREDPGYTPQRPQTDAEYYGDYYAGLSDAYFTGPSSRSYDVPKEGPVAIDALKGSRPDSPYHAWVREYQNLTGKIGSAPPSDWVSPSGLTPKGQTQGGTTTALLEDPAGPSLWTFEQHTVPSIKGTTAAPTRPDFSVSVSEARANQVLAQAQQSLANANTIEAAYAASRNVERAKELVTQSRAPWRAQTRQSFTAQAEVTPQGLTVPVGTTKALYAPAGVLPERNPANLLVETPVKAPGLQTVPRTEFQTVPRTEFQPLLKTDLQPLLKTDLQPLLKTDLQPLLKTEFQPLLKTEFQPLLKTDLQPLLKTDLQPLLKTDLQPLLKTDLQPLLQTEFQPSLKTDLQPSLKTDLQPSLKTDLQPSLKTDLQPSLKTDLQPSLKTDLQPSLKTDLQPSLKTDLQPSLKTDLQPSLKTDLQPSLKTDLQPSLKTDLQPSLKTDLQPSLKTDLQPSLKTDLQPSLKTDLQPSLKTDLQPSLKTDLQPSLKTDLQPSLKTALQPSLKTALQPSLKTALQTVPRIKAPHPTPPPGSPRHGPKQAVAQDLPLGRLHPHVAEFVALEHHLVDLRTGGVEETPLDDRHLETLRVTKRGRASTHGTDVDTGGSTLKSRRGQVSLEDNRTITPRPGVMGRPRPVKNGGFPRGRGRRRRDEDAAEDYNGRNEVVITMR